MGTLQRRLIGSAVLAAALALSSVSSTKADEHRVIVGMATTSVNVTTWWHGENALDVTNRLGDTANASVYHQSRFYSGSGGWIRAVARDYSISSSCHGRYVDLYDPGGNYLGTLNYVHVLSSLPENYTWIIPASGWNTVFLGTVIYPEASGCPCTGAHLHQGGVGARVQYNAGLESYVASQGQPDIISPTGDYTNRWIDKVTLVDSDGDGVPDTSDNCPNAYNPGQENFDADGPPWGNGPGIGNGTGIPGNDATVPNGDGWGNACDPDMDNDGIPNGSDPDPGGDVTYDDNNDGIWKGAGDDGPSWDTNMNAERDGVDGICPLAVNPNGDDDGDGLVNTWEVCKWGTDPSYWDTDGDGLGDCKEAMDVNGNGLVTAADATFILQASFDLIGKDGDFDINGNGQINATDATFVKQAYFGVNPCQ